MEILEERTVGRRWRRFGPTGVALDDRLLIVVLFMLVYYRLSASRDSRSDPESPAVARHDGILIRPYASGIAASR